MSLIDLYLPDFLTSFFHVLALLIFFFACLPYPPKYASSLPLLLFIFPLLYMFLLSVKLDGEGKNWGGNCRGMDGMR